jgi:hypothetical protein
MLRFTLRDMLWLVALIGVGLAWWMEQRKVIAVRQERDEAIARWHDASKKWVEATERIPRNPFFDGLGEACAPIPKTPGAKRRQTGSLKQFGD